MAYDANVPADNLAISGIPAAVRAKGADVKALVDAHTGAASGAHADSAISAAANGVLGAGSVRSQLGLLDTTQREAKTTPVDADLIGLNDSEASNAKKKLTWANLKSTLFGTPAADGYLLSSTAAGVRSWVVGVLATVLTGLSLATATAVTAADTILVAIGKLQAQVTARLPLAGGALTGAINEASASVASATTCDIGAAAGNFVTITGTTTITALGTVQAGTRRHVRFAGALTLTHNATSLILPTGANITTAAGDTATFISLGSGNWVCVDYQRANGTALVGGVVAGQVVQVVSVTKTDTFATTSTSFTDITGLAATITPSSAANKIMVIFNLAGNSIGYSLFRLMRGATVISAGDVAGSRGAASCGGLYNNGNTVHLLSTGGNYLDSPATTAAVTYKLQGLVGSSTLYVNRSADDGDYGDRGRAVSSITLLEVKG